MTNEEAIDIRSRIREEYTQMIGRYREHGKTDQEIIDYLTEMLVANDMNCSSILERGGGNVR